ncbi:MAG: glycosyl hydrolase [Elusimicrobia bacterium]|nr:glycosyl hydrolase [Elusimicrobiota bacterium]
MRKKSGRAGVAVLVGTRKGAFILRADAARRRWRIEGPHFLGCIVHHLVLDPRDGRTLLAACRTGHLGPTVYRSTNMGRTWTEAKRPPAFRKAAEGGKGRAVDHVFWLTPGHAAQKGVWYAGTSPQGLVRSDDSGATWTGVGGFNDSPDLTKWVGGAQDLTPDGGKTHSVLVDPRDPAHLYLGLSAGGFFESLDSGASWRRLNKGCDRVFPSADPDEGHDPHCVRLHPAAPDRLYMQNHCGIYRIDRPSDAWSRVGRRMPKAVGDIGFPMTLHPRDPDTAWVFPMDGGSVWPRVSPDGRPAAYRTRDGGRSWQRQDRGLPREQAWFTVKRQAMCADDADPVGVYFGTTSGEVWASSDEGAGWRCLAAHLPHIYSVETGRV